MHLKRYLLVLFISIGIFAMGRSSEKKDTATVNKLLDESKALIVTDSAKSALLSAKALKMAQEIGYKKGEGYALKYLGMLLYNKGLYVETLDYWSKSLAVFESIPDNTGISNMLSNIGAIYLNQGADEKALEYTLRSLKIAEQMGDTARMITALTNVGSIYHNKKDPKALDYYLRVLPLVNNKDKLVEYVDITGNMGEIYYDRKDYEKASEYFQKSIKAAGTDLSAAFPLNGLGKIYLKDGKLSLALSYHKNALEIAIKFGEQLQQLRSLRDIANVYFAESKIPLAINYYNKARASAEGMDDKVELAEIYKYLTVSYSKEKDYDSAFKYQRLFLNVKDTLYDNESKKRSNQIQFDFELSKKQGEIALQEEKISSDQKTKLGITITLFIILISAFVVYRYYLKSLKTNKVLDKQKDEIEGLLLNILPHEVANELKASGSSIPRHFDDVSVLFTDFYGFTRIADKMTPTELVHQLNDCFIAFDNIVEKNNLEKIKTIGDSYMCAGNIPSANPDNGYKTVKVAMEMLDFLHNQNQERLAKGLEVWEIRIGIHVGPVVAGVVGRKKYAYDIWGSTVNIASRMESNAVPGRINLSEQAYLQVKDRFECSHRGKIQAKNLGELDMYYVEYEKNSSEVLK